MKARDFEGDVVSLALDAAERMLIRIGYSRMSMMDVANESSIEPQALYLHFRNKGDLILAREDRITKSVRGGLLRVARSAGQWDDKIRKMLDFRVLLRFDSVQHIPESIDDILRDVGPDLREREELYCREESRILGGVLLRGAKIARLHPRACPVLADALIAATNSLLPYHLTKRDMRRNDADAEEKISRVIDVVLHGLRGALHVTDEKRRGSLRACRSGSRIKRGELVVF